jgi:hypothetical protein
MNVRGKWITIFVVALLAISAAVVVAAPLAQGLIVDAEINYQGRLTNLDGDPLDGDFPMQFQLYDAQIGGTLLWDSGGIIVAVDDGLFNVKLPIDPAHADGQELWLRIAVAGEWLTPREELLPVPYAYSLRPGAIVRGAPTAWGGYVLQVDMEGTYPVASGILGTTATGSAVTGSSTGGWGLHGYTELGRAVVGIDGGTDQARGYGGWFQSNTGVGVYGYSNAPTAGNNAYAPGVWGRSVNGIGVLGFSDDGLAGVRGVGPEIGVYGVSSGGQPGVKGWSIGTGVYGKTSGTNSSNYGVYGEGDGWAYGVYGHQLDETTGGLGVYGRNEGTASGVSGLSMGGVGTHGFSYSFRGVNGATNRGDNNYGLYTDDNLYALNYHLAGAVMQVVQNAGDEPLERGDLVAVAGMGRADVEGAPPILLVRQAAEAGTTAVVGVVYSTYPAEWLVDDAGEDPTGALGSGKPAPDTTSGPVAPGDYLLVVVQGPAQVKASAVAGAIAPGDLLSAAGEPGLAGRAAEIEVRGARMALPGTVVGKALEPLAGDEGLIYVFVTLQ